MTEGDRFDAEEYAEHLAHCLHSAIYEMAMMVSRGDGDFVDDADLLAAMSQLQGLIDYKHLHRKRAA